MTTNRKFGVGEYTMRCGDAATVYEVTAQGKLLGAYTNGNSGRAATSWKCDGRWLTGTNSDLDIMPPKRKAWLNIYSSDYYEQDEFIPVRLFTKKAMADSQAGGFRIACIEVEYEDGEGL